MVRECLVKHQPDLIVFQETKKDCMSNKLVKSVAGKYASYWIALPAIGTTGGILLAWNSSVIKALNARMGSFSISIEIEDVSLGLFSFSQGCMGL